MIIVDRVDLPCDSCTPEKLICKPHNKNNNNWKITIIPDNERDPIEVVVCPECIKKVKGLLKVLGA